MKVNKKPKSVDTYTATMGTMLKSLAEMNEAMEKLRAKVSQQSRGMMVMQAFRDYPYSMSVLDPEKGTEVHMDTNSFMFSGAELGDVWTHLRMDNWLERQFNELEGVDYHNIHNLIIGTEKDVYTIALFIKMVEEYLDNHYPEPQTEPFYSFNGFTMEEKHYFLPGLKVLHQDSDGEFWSPIYPVKWEDGTMTARHYAHSGNAAEIRVLKEHGDISQDMKGCYCGVYASCNMEELHEYMHITGEQQQAFGMDSRFGPEYRKLCIIEPLSDATVWMARKGWKSNDAFISEVIGETMEPAVASNLLSMVWKRPIDVNSILRSQE